MGGRQSRRAAPTRVVACSSQSLRYDVRVDRLAARTEAITPAGVILLAAGRGSRLSSLTEHTHKSLLPVVGKPALQYAMDEVLSRGVNDVVVVTGDKRDSIERFVEERYAGRVTLAHNERYASDTNILSTEVGVSALRRPEDGYMIVETDLVMDPAGWDAALDVGDRRTSYWVTKSAYGESLTGGALLADAGGRVVALVYAPKYAPEYEGWQKLLGLLYVGSDQVANDREFRRKGIERTIAQYYMMPWVENLPLLPCRARSLGGLYAASFNDLEGYRLANQRFNAVLGAREGSE